MKNYDVPFIYKVYKINTDKFHYPLIHILVLCKLVMALHGKNISTQLIRLNVDVKSELDEIGKKKETYSDIIRRLLENFKEANQE